MTVKHGLLNIFVVEVFIHSVVSIRFEFTVVPEFVEIVFVNNTKVITHKQCLVFVLLLVLVSFGVVRPAVILKTERHCYQVFKSTVDFCVLSVVWIYFVKADHSICGCDHELLRKSHPSNGCYRVISHFDSHLIEKTHALPDFDDPIS